MEIALRRVITGSLAGLGTALAFSVSPVFVRMGMREGHSAETALVVGLVAALISYAGILAIIDRNSLRIRIGSHLRPLAWETAAAVSIVTGTWLRYVAMSLIPLAIVSAVGRVNLLVILLFARRAITPRVWLGAALILSGTLLLSL